MIGTSSSVRSMSRAEVVSKSNRPGGNGLGGDIYIYHDNVKMYMSPLNAFPLGLLLLLTTSYLLMLLTLLLIPLMILFFIKAHTVPPVTP